jgi:hypothetical protein
MNVFNRVTIVVLALAAIVAVTAICLFPDFFIERLSELAQWLNGIQPRLALVDRLILIGIFVAVDFVLLLLVVLELRRPGAKAVRVQQVEGGTALLTADSIKRRLAFHIDGLPDVVGVKPQVQIKGDTVRVAVDVQTSAAVNVPGMAREIVSVIRMVITETMGLKLKGVPQVNIRTGSYKDVALPPAEAAVEPAAEVAPRQEPPLAAEAEPGYAAYEEVVLSPEKTPPSVAVEEEGLESPAAIPTPPDEEE